MKYIEFSILIARNLTKNDNIDTYNNVLASAAHRLTLRFLSSITCAPTFRVTRLSTGVWLSRNFWSLGSLSCAVNLKIDK